MEVLLIFDAQFVGREEKIVFIEKLENKAIEQAFIEWLGFYDDNCSYKVIF